MPDFITTKCPICQHQYEDSTNPMEYPASVQCMLHIMQDHYPSSPENIQFIEPTGITITHDIELSLDGPTRRLALWTLGFAKDDDVPHLHVTFLSYEVAVQLGNKLIYNADPRIVEKVYKAYRDGKVFGVNDVDTEDSGNG